ncbi:MAG: hypothetical protein RBR52_14995 [Thiomonas sp.]|uniref:hypothetical protein n=1 Tax=Thiomonas sp. TaxID=2047785 RepID=UPI002A358B0C|nr:hypothetical protein [Thiomonas sp.]MDY0331783.1 hypothetical protein [Thiomonas sp.]
MTPKERRSRDEAMRYARMRCATIWEIARQFGLSKSHTHRIVADVELLPHIASEHELIPLAGGGYAWRTVTRPEKTRAYRVKDGKCVFPG